MQGGLLFNAEHRMQAAFILHEIAQQIASEVLPELAASEAEPAAVRELAAALLGGGADAVRNLTPQAFAALCHSGTLHASVGSLHGSGRHGLHVEPVFGVPTSAIPSLPAGRPAHWDGATAPQLAAQRLSTQPTFSAPLSTPPPPSLAALPGQWQPATPR